MTKKDFNKKALAEAFVGGCWTLAVGYLIMQIGRWLAQSFWDPTAFDGGWFPLVPSAVVAVLTVLIAVALFFNSRACLLDEHVHAEKTKKRHAESRAKYEPSRLPLIIRTEELTAKADKLLAAMKFIEGSVLFPAGKAAEEVRKVAATVRHDLSRYGGGDTDESNAKLLESTSFALDLLAPYVKVMDEALELHTSATKALPVGAEPRDIVIDYSPANGYLQPPQGDTIRV